MTWIAVVLAIAIAVFALPYLGGRKARWFRRIWASQQVGGLQGGGWRIEAAQKLLDIYGIDFASDAETLRAKFGEMFADASHFDISNSNNRGIQVMPLLAKSVLSNKGDARHPELNDDLNKMIETDGVALHAAFMKTLGQE